MKFCFYCLSFLCFFCLKTNVVFAQCTADAGPDLILTCAISEVTLAGSSNVPNAQYSWVGPNNFTATVASPKVNKPGQYTLTITNPANGCTDSDEALVTEDKAAPFFTLISNSSCGNTGSVRVEGGPGLLYQWSNGQTGSMIDSLPGGLYCVVVTGPNGCSASDCEMVTQLAPALVGSSVANPFEDNKNGSIALTPVPAGTSFGYQWTGPNGFTATTPSITGLDQGTYTVTVTNPASGCTSVYTFVLTRTYAPLTIYNVVHCDGLVHFQISPSQAPYTIAWGNESTQVTQPEASLALAPGTYTITVTGGNNSSKTTTVVVPPLSPPCTFIEGDIRYDENNDCQPGATEPGLGGWFVRAEGNGEVFYAISNTDGHYVLRIQPGTFVLTLHLPGSSFTVCDNDVPVFIASAGDTETVHFSVQGPDPDCPALEVNLGTPFLRRCFDNNFYQLNYCNNSLATASDAYIDFTLPPLLEIITTSHPYTDLGNHLYRFQLGTIPAFECGNIWLKVAVSCDAMLGQTHCSEAHIFPDTLCEPADPLWSGALLQVYSLCDGDSLRFILKNTGAAAMSESFDYIVIEDGAMGRQGNAPPLAAGDSLIVSVPANGSTWRLETEQEPLAPAAPQPVLSVEGCVTNNTFSTGFINLFDLGDDVPWIDKNCMPNIGSYDPNDKQGFPQGFGAKHFIRPGTELEYLIRFQNTGTDTAFTVVIRDTLSEWLDPLAVQPGASSHPYRFEITGPGILIFEFQNILLPDSNVNEAASHGFVQFRIRPRAEAPLETDIFNKAAIYFDFNNPVITNTTVHRIGENFLVGLWQPEKPEYTVSIIPHPITDASWIAISGQTALIRQTGSARLCVFDLTGRLVRVLNATEPRFLLRKNDLPEGTYLFKVDVDGVIVGSGKLVAF